jgi:hypothetical protein
MRKILFFLILKCYSLLAQEQMVVSPINTSDGLADNRVKAICQLLDGRMIFVTEGMVNIYDGARFTYMHFNEQKVYSIKNYSDFHRVYVDRDNNLWIKDHFKLLHFDLSTEKYVENLDTVFLRYGIKKQVSDFFVDSYFNYWFLTNDDELFYRDTKENTTFYFASKISSPNRQTDILFDLAVRDSLVFLFYKSGLMVCHNIYSKKELYQDNIYEGKVNRFNTNLVVVPYKQYLYQLRNGFAIGSNLHRYNILSRKWEKIFEKTWQNTLSVDNKGNCMVSSTQGLWTINESLLKTNLFKQLITLQGNIIKTEISTQYVDNNGGLWLGTMDKGLLYYHPERFKFRNFGRSFFEFENDFRINCLADHNGDILIGTSHGIFNYQQNQQKIIKYSKIPENVVCNSLIKDSKKRIWVCTNSHGLYCISGDNIKHYDLPFWCQSFYESGNGKYYLCTDFGFGVFDPETGRFDKVEASKKLERIYELMDFEKHKLLGVAYGDAGLFIYDTDNNKLSFPDENRYWMLRHNNRKCHDMYTDQRGLVWFGTQDGLNVYDPHNDNLQSFFEKDGLANNNIRSVIEDNTGRIWVSTAYGISCVNVSKSDQGYEYSFANFNQYDGVIDGEFIPRSVVKTSDNRLLWGGMDGFNEIDITHFNPSEQKLSIPLFTQFLLFNREIKVGEQYEGKVILEKSISSTKIIELEHFQNFFSFEFSALNYVNPTQTFYRYKLEGVDAAWNETDATNGIGRVNYTNIVPGKYLLKVYAANNSRRWGKKGANITIIIHPPFWETPVAYIIYVVLFLAVFSLLTYYYIHNNKQKMYKKQKEELDKLKITFFTNISHEFRTPITLILTPLESIIKKLSDIPLKNQLSSIYRNASELLKLVNQLLDFRKLEINGEKLKLSYCDVEEFLHEIVTSFEELAEEKLYNFLLLLMLTASRHILTKINFIKL